MRQTGFFTFESQAQRVRGVLDQGGLLFGQPKPLPARKQYGRSGRRRERNSQDPRPPAAAEPSA